VSRWALLLPILMVPACSDLTEGAGGVISLQINQPPATELEVGQTMALTATALDKDGNPIPAAVTWRAPDATLTVDPATGVITGVSPGTGRVQAFAGELGSNLLTFTVLSRADTLIVTDSVLTVGPGLNSPALVAQLQTFTPPGQGVANRPVVYTITSPLDVPPPTVELPGAVRTLTVNTGTDGAVSSVTLNRVLNVAQPDTAIVTVSASRPDGSLVPGSGQRFIVLFQ
jgi:hypothetical protein